MICHTDLDTATDTPLLVSFSLRGMVVIKGRRPDGTVDADGYDTGEESDEEEGQEVPIDGIGDNARVRKRNV